MVHYPVIALRAENGRENQENFHEVHQGATGLMGYMGFKHLKWDSPGVETYLVLCSVPENGMIKHSYPK